MRAFVGVLLAGLPCAVAAAQETATVSAPAVLYFPNANSRPTYLTVHRVAEAWPLSRGAGVKVGILDHSFGFQTHLELYAGGENFQTATWGASFDTVSHHGFWMASTLREIAPAAEIYALGTYAPDEGSRVEAMVRAIDWAIEHDLDVLSYSAQRFTPAVRAALDSAVDRALAHDIVIVFLHYPHPGNLLPTWLGPRTGDDERKPDVNILHYDYSVLLTGPYGDWLQRGAASGYRPFLSLSSTAPVTAGFVALLRSVRPDLRPDDVRRVLAETSRAITFEGSPSPRTVDAAAALRRVIR